MFHFDLIMKILRSELLANRNPMCNAKNNNNKNNNNNDDNADNNNRLIMFCYSLAYQFVCPYSRVQNKSRCVFPFVEIFHFHFKFFMKF